MAGIIFYLIKEKKHTPNKPYAFFNELFYTSECNAINLLRDKLILAKTSKIHNSLINAYTIKAWNSYISGSNLKILKYNEIENVEYI